MAFDKEKYIVRCTKCVIGKDKQGKPVGGVLSRINATTAQCCSCNAVYTVKPRVEKPYNPDQYHESPEVHF